MTDSFDELKKRAAGGDAKAMFALGVMYYKGDGVPVNKDKAREWWEKAAKAGDVEAIFYLGLMYAKGDGIPVDKDKARKWWEKAAKAGNAEAMFNLGVMYNEGDGVPVDKDKAREWWEKAAKKDNTEAMSNLGVMYNKGDGVTADKAKAKELWQKAAEKGNAGAMFNLGVMYNKGDGVPIDKDKARELLEKAAEKGNAEAMYNLGAMHYTGDGVPVDKDKTREWGEKAAAAGHAGAMFNLGQMCYEGDGVPVDKDKARKWWKKAAIASNTLAMLNLGVMYHKGDGVPVNKKEAAEWWKKAAVAGNARAMTILGLMYDKGDGITVDKKEAQKWWEKATDAGNVLAGISLILRSHIDDYTPFYNLYKKVDELKRKQHWVNPKHSPEIKVCHYTNIEAVRSMLEENKSPTQPRNILRMYNIGYVNDPLDGKALVNYSEDNGGVLHEFFEEGKKGEKKKSEDDDEPLSKYVYFASFTGAKDRLDLWRAYGRDGAGCCIVIPPAEFDEEPKGLAEVLMQNIRTDIATESKTALAGMRFETGTEKEKFPEHPRMCLYRVLYTEEKKAEALETLKGHLEEIKSIKDEIKMPDEKETMTARKKIDEVVRIILSDVLYLYKNKEYSTENELRMVSTHLDSDSSLLIDEGKRETGMRHLFVETRPFLFNKPGYEIVIGPKVTDPYAAQREIEHLLHKRNFAGNVTVRLSNVPYR